MQRQERALFSRLPPANPSEGLFERVMGSIRAAELRRLRQRLAVTVSGFAAVLGYGVWYWMGFWQEMQSSSFFDLLRLAVSDPDVAFANVPDLLLGLMETLPFQSILFSVVVSFVFFAVIALVKSLREARRLPSLPEMIPTN